MKILRKAYIWALLLSLPILLIFAYIIVWYSFSSKYWWYDQERSSALFPEVGISDVFRDLSCPESNDNPFEYQYPEDSSNNISRNQLVVFDIKPGYDVHLYQVKDEKGIVNTKLPYFDLIRQRQNPNRIIAYPFGTMYESIFDELYKKSKEELRIHPAVDNQIDSDKFTWGKNNKITFYFSYSKSESLCRYPLYYSFTTGDN